MARAPAHFEKPPHFIRQWRRQRALTLEQLAERVGMTHQNLGKIERYLVPYSQALLEGLAEALGTEPASLIMRNPEDAGAAWSLIDSVSPTERAQVVHFIQAIRSAKADR